MIVSRTPDHIRLNLLGDQLFLSLNIATEFRNQSQMNFSIWDRYSNSDSILSLLKVEHHSKITVADRNVSGVISSERTADKFSNETVACPGGTIRRKLFSVRIIPGKALRRRKNLWIYLTIFILTAVCKCHILDRTRCSRLLGPKRQRELPKCRIALPKKRSWIRHCNEIVLECFEVVWSTIDARTIPGSARTHARDGSF